MKRMIRHRSVTMVAAVILLATIAGCGRSPDERLAEFAQQTMTEQIVSFRQACLKGFCGPGTLVVFLFGEDNDGWAKTWRDWRGIGTWARSI